MRETMVDMRRDFEIEHRSSLPIGVFDSGVGGLTVAAAIQSQLPNEQIYYFGDMARCPYGDRDLLEVRTYSREVLDFLYELGVKMFVVACNTATAAALPMLRSRYDIPVIGVIEPGARAALRRTNTGRVGVIGTAVTVASGAYGYAIHQLAPSVEVFSAACPKFVPLVEQGLVAGEAVESVVRDALTNLLAEEIDSLILGCTHYPLLMDPIRTVAGPSVEVISSADETALEVQNVLARLGALWEPTQGLLREPARATGDRLHRFYTSGDGTRMRRALRQWLQLPADAADVRVVDVHRWAEAETY